MLAVPAPDSEVGGNISGFGELRGQFGPPVRCRLSPAPQLADCQQHMALTRRQPSGDPKLSGPPDHDLDSPPFCVKMTWRPGLGNGDRLRGTDHRLSPPTHRPTDAARQIVTVRRRQSWSTMLVPLGTPSSRSLLVTALVPSSMFFRREQFRAANHIVRRWAPPQIRSRLAGEPMMPGAGEQTLTAARRLSPFTRTPSASTSR